MNCESDFMVLRSRFQKSGLLKETLPAGSCSAERVCMFLFTLLLSEIFDELYKDSSYFSAGGGGLRGKEVARLT